MKTLSCKNMGLNCDFTATGATYEDVIKEFLTHAQECHSEKTDKIIRVLSPQEIKLILMQYVKE